jgi:hypothetical protein
VRTRYLVRHRCGPSSFEAAGPSWEGSSPGARVRESDGKAIGDATDPVPVVGRRAGRWFRGGGLWYGSRWATTLAAGDFDGDGYGDLAIGGWATGPGFGCSTLPPRSQQDRHPAAQPRPCAGRRRRQLAVRHEPDRRELRPRRADDLAIGSSCRSSRWLPGKANCVAATLPSGSGVASCSVASDKRCKFIAPGSRVPRPRTFGVGLFVGEVREAALSFRGRRPRKSKSVTATI